MAQGSKRRWFGRGASAAPPTVPPSTTAPPSVAPPAEPAVTAVPETDEPDRPSAEELYAISARLTDYVHVQVRSGIYDVAALRDLTLDAAGQELRDADEADEVARQVLSAELEQWHADADRWGARTDCDRLDAAIGHMSASGVLTLPGILDDQSLAESLRIRASEGGYVAYQVADIWRAIDTNSLKLTVLDSAGQPAGRHSPVSRAAIDALAEAGLLGTAGTGEGQIEVALVWRRRPSD